MTMTPLPDAHVSKLVELQTVRLVTPPVLGIQATARNSGRGLIAMDCVGCGSAAVTERPAAPVVRDVTERMTVLGG